MATPTPTPTVARDRRMHGSRLVFRAIAMRFLAFATFWAGVWAIQWQFDPDWMVATRIGLSTLLQALPAAIFGLFALIVASLFVLGQQAVSLHGARAVIVLIEDPAVGSLVLRALALGIAALLLGGQVPDTGDSAPSVTAGVATIAVATAVLLLGAANALLVLLGVYTAPRNFMLRATTSVPFHLRSGVIDTVVYKIPMLGEMIRAGLRRGESVIVSAALEGLAGIQGGSPAARGQHSPPRPLGSHPSINGR